MSKMRILLTGGRGMVGRNVLDHPVIGQYEVIAPRSSELDLRNFDAVQEYFREHQPEMVVHAAGKVGGIHANIREPVAFLLDNLDMGRNVVLAARNLRIKRLLNLGSSCMYPRNAPNPLREEMVLAGELEPTNEGYALAKVMVARLCDYIAREDAFFEYKSLIPCNIYGRYDKFDPANSHLIPAIIHKLHEAKQNGSCEVEIWGSGEARREFMYAGDLADCIWHAVECFESMPNYLNAGLGCDLSINEYYEAAAKIVGYAGGFVRDLSKPEGMKQKLVSTKKLESWGWQSRTSLDEGVALTYQYYLEKLQA